MSAHTDTNGIRTTWSIRERWSGSSVELPNFIKWLKQHSEGEVNSYFYQKIIDGEDIFNLLPDTHIASAVYRTSDGGTSDFSTEPQIRKANLTTMQKYVDKASELRLSQSTVAHIQVNGNNLNATEQRQLHQRLNSRTARIVASNTANRALQARHKQTRLQF